MPDLPRPVRLRAREGRKVIEITFDGPVPPSKLVSRRAFASFMLVAAALEDWNA